MEFAAEILSSRAGAGRAYGEQLDDGEVRPSEPAGFEEAPGRWHQAARLLAGDHAASFKSAMEIYAEISATNPNFKKVYASLTDFANDGYQWWQVAELGFDAFMV